MATSKSSKTHLMLKTPMPRGAGRFSSVSMCTYKGATVVVNVHDISADFSLYFQVGIVDKDADTTEWGDAIIYDTGKHPSISLICIDDSLYAIECHCSDARNRCFYHVGKVYAGKLNTIVWGKVVDFCEGKKPKVSANDNGTIMIVKEKPAYFYSTLIQYFIGTINIEKLNIDWKISDDILPSFEGAEPNISTTSDKVCCYGSDIRFKMGTIKNDLTIAWKDSTSSNIDTTGNHPSVSINSHGNVVAFHQSGNSRALCFWYGIIEDNLIALEKDREHDNGEYTTIFLSEDGYIYEMHKSHVGFTLWYTQGELKKKLVDDFNCCM